MKSPDSNHYLLAGLFTAMLLAVGSTAQAADASVTLKDAFKEHFPIGTAVNRSMVTGGPGFRRSVEQNAADVALLKQQFNQITAENDTKWQLIHPREGKDGYDFGAADAFVKFGLSNNVQIAGHTLVWHSQTPNFVFAGTNPALLPFGIRNFDIYGGFSPRFLFSFGSSPFDAIAAAAN